MTEMALTQPRSRIFPAGVWVVTGSVQFLGLETKIVNVKRKKLQEFGRARCSIYCQNETKKVIVQRSKRPRHTVRSKKCITKGIKMHKPAVEVNFLSDSMLFHILNDPRKRSSKKIGGCLIKARFLPPRRFHALISPTLH